jgi:NADH:ubiquinone oxidoreductase subunit 2 (subunit N)
MSLAPPAIVPAPSVRAASATSIVPVIASMLALPGAAAGVVPALAPVLALLAAGLMLWLDRRHGLGFSISALIAAALLAGVVGGRFALGDAGPALLSFAVIGALVRQRDDVLPSECAVKLLWVLGVSLALSWAGMALFATATGTAINEERWAVLRAGADPDALWTAALPLSLLVGLVLVGGAPFHFWAADVVQGARAGFAALAIAGLQVTGITWLDRRLAGIGDFPPAARVADSVLATAAAAAFVVGAVTLTGQRRPERRVGTLASLNGALALCAMVVIHGAGRHVAQPLFSREAWAANLALSLTGAGLLSRFLPVRRREMADPSVLFRRHPWVGACGLYALCSLAGVPGTPGARVWLAAARDLVAGGRTGLVVALGIAWTVSFAIAVGDCRAAFGVPVSEPAPPVAVPWPARIALVLAAAGLVALLVVGN